MLINIFRLQGSTYIHMYYIIKCSHSIIFVRVSRVLFIRSFVYVHSVKCVSWGFLAQSPQQTTAYYYIPCFTPQSCDIVYFVTALSLPTAFY